MTLHKRNGAMSVQVRKTEKQKPCVYNTAKISVQNILLSCAVSAKDCKPTLSCYIVMLST